jgi:hypothetical protein
MKSHAKIKNWEQKKSMNKMVIKINLLWTIGNFAFPGCVWVIYLLGQPLA